MHRDKDRHTGEILLDVSVSVWVVGSLYGCVLMFSIDLSVVNAVVMATITHPSPPTLVILSLKSTELWLGGFHFRMSSHLPGLYFYRDAKNTETNHFMTKQTMQEKNNTPLLALKKNECYILSTVTHHQFVGRPENSETQKSDVSIYTVSWRNWLYSQTY